MKQAKSFQSESDNSEVDTQQSFKNFISTSVPDFKPKINISETPYLKSPDSILSEQSSDSSESSELSDSLELPVSELIVSESPESESPESESPESEPISQFSQFKLIEKKTKSKSKKTKSKSKKTKSKPKKTKSKPKKTKSKPKKTKSKPKKTKSKPKKTKSKSKKTKSKSKKRVYSGGDGNEEDLKDVDDNKSESYFDLENNTQNENAQEWIEQNCANNSEEYTKDDYNDMYTVKILNELNKFNIGICSTKQQIISSMDDPSNIMSIYTSSDEPSIKIVIKITSDDYFVTLGSLKRIFNENNKIWYALPMYDGKRIRIGNMDGEQISDSIIYKLYKKDEIVNRVRVKEELNEDYPLSPVTDSPDIKITTIIKQYFTDMYKL
jgi:hypothetical protein